TIFCYPSITKNQRDGYEENLSEMPSHRANHSKHGSNSPSSDEHFGASDRRCKWVATCGSKYRCEGKGNGYHYGYRRQVQFKCNCRPSSNPGCFLCRLSKSGNTHH